MSTSTLQFEINVETIDDNTIIMTIQSNKTILDDKLTVFSLDNDEIDFKIVDNLVAEFNRVSNKLVSDYNYELVNKKCLVMKVVMKHMFKKFGEAQRWVNYAITCEKRNPNNEMDKTIVCMNNNNKQYKITLNTPIQSIQAPFNRIEITNTKIVDDVNTTVIRITTNDPVSSYKNFDMIITFTKLLIHNNYKNIENYVNICNGLKPVIETSDLKPVI